MQVNPSLQGPLVIHASAVNTKQGVVVFLGPSGTGKSTICQLLSSVSDKWADDVAHLTLTEVNQWYITKAPDYKGLLSQTSLVERDRAPLLAIVRLYQAQTSRLRTIDSFRTCCYLVQAMFDVKILLTYDHDSKGRLFALAASVARSTPGYLFYFNLSQSSESLFLDICNSGRRACNG